MGVDGTQWPAQKSVYCYVQVGDKGDDERRLNFAETSGLHK